MGIWDWDRRTDLLEWSRQHYTMMGLLPNSVTPTYKLWEERVHPEDLPMVRAELKRAVAERTNFRSEYRVILDGGIHRWVTSRGEPIYEAGGECVGMTGVSIDTTVRKHWELRQNLQSRITRVLSEAASLADAASPLIRTISDCFDWHYGELWQVQSNRNLLSFLDAYPDVEDFAEFINASRALTLKPGSGLPGRVWQSATPAWITHIPSPAHSGRAELAQKAGFASTFSFPINAGARIVGVMAFFSRYTREPDPDQLEIVHSIGGQIGQFVERKQAERALRASEERNRAILESALDSIITVDERGTIIEFNPAAEKTFGYTRSYALGKRIGALIAPPAQNERGLTHFLTSGLPGILDKRLETTAMRSDGGEFPIELTVTRIAWDGPPMFTAYIRDITERKRREQALRDAVAEVHRLKEQVEADNLYLREELSEAHREGQIVGNSDALRKILRRVEQVAATDMTVLILGETGTGKELVARAIHESSARKQRPLVKVNCSALPAELIESELFGHEKGAFTGATTRRIGRFELADGGTIFLDEIGDLALSLQVKLLRVLQEGEFERLGSSKTIRVNVRVIAATNRDLSEAMRRELFRSDLYYRLAVYPIQIPPLRERKEDIKLLAESFLVEASRRLGRSFDAIPCQVLNALEHYDWPGNIRELQNVIERAAVTSAGRILRLPEEWHPEPQARDISLETSIFEHEAGPVGPNLQSLERAHILQVLTQTHWRIEGPNGAAVILGLRPSTLRSRMRKLGISRSEPLLI
jgi:PAS domain S-box-containing protein